MCRLAAQIKGGGGVVNGFSFKRLEERKLNSVYQLHLLNVSAARGNPKINIKTPNHKGRSSHDRRTAPDTSTHPPQTVTLILRIINVRSCLFPIQHTTPPKSLIYLHLSGNFMGFMSPMLIISTAHFGGTVHTVTSNFTSVIFPSFTDSQENTAAEASQEPKM